jgi:hypothetical protein
MARIPEEREAEWRCYRDPIKFTNVEHEWLSVHDIWNQQHARLSLCKQRSCDMDKFGPNRFDKFQHKLYRCQCE